MLPTSTRAVKDRRLRLLDREIRYTTAKPRDYDAPKSGEKDDKLKIRGLAISLRAEESRG
jgi:hypothetical protein